jgi:hypothetical protein
MLRKHILTLTFALLLTLPGCGREPSSATVHTEPTDLASTTVHPTVSSNPTVPESKIYKIFELNGMRIRLPSYFKINASHPTPGFECWHSGILVTREPFTVHPDLSGMTLDEYGQTLIQMGGISAQLQRMDGITYFEYEVPVSDGAFYHYLVTLFKSETDFWIIEFVCDSREADMHRVEFMQWAKTIEFSKEKN